MGCAFGGANPIQMSLTGSFFLVPRHHLARDLRQTGVGQVCEIELRNLIIKRSVAIAILKKRQMSVASA